MAKLAAFGCAIKQGSAPLGGEPTRTLTAATAAANIATFTTSVAHGYSIGDYVTVSGVTPAGYNGAWVITTLPTGSQFTAYIGSTPGAGTVFGTSLRSDTFATVLQVLDITGLSIGTNMIDVTTHDSAGAWKEMLAGLVDGGEISFDVVYDPDNATHAALKNDTVNRVVNRNWKIITTAVTLKEFRFAGSMSKFEVKNPLDGAIGASVTFKVSGQPIGLAVAP